MEKQKEVIASEAPGGFSDAAPEHYQPYRAVSKAAVISAILGLIGVLGLLSPAMLVLPILALLFSLQAFSALRRYPDELTGKFPAAVGLTFGLLLSFGGIGYHTYVYLTEVPDGYQRITFSELQPERIDQVLPPDADKLDKKPVFIKGYMHPSGTQGMGAVNKFILVPDMGTCCFGGQPKLTDMVEVTLGEGLTTTYSRRKKKLAGTFLVDSELKPVSGLEGVYYQLNANYVR